MRLFQAVRYALPSLVRLHWAEYSVIKAPLINRRCSLLKTRYSIQSFVFRYTMIFLLAPVLADLPWLSETIVTGF